MTATGLLLAYLACGLSHAFTLWIAEADEDLPFFPCLVVMLILTCFWPVSLGWFLVERLSRVKL